MKGLIINANSPRGEILKQKSEQVTENNYKQVAKQFLKKVLPLRVGDRCQGVSGNQVGMSESIFTAMVKGRWVMWINPEIVHKGGKVVKSNEGCLSIPHKRIKVPRNTHITLNYRDKGFESNTIELYGNDAIVVQHEVDHLNGKLITDYKEQGGKFVTEEELTNMLDDKDGYLHEQTNRTN